MINAKKEYTVGDAITATLRVREGNLLLDPSGGVTSRILLPTGEEETGTVINTSVGVYQTTFIVEESGRYYIRFETEGDYQGALEDYVVVAISRFA